MMNYNLFAELITKYENIIIFTHINPDCDALGSSHGLKKLINLNFKTNAYVYHENDVNDIYPKCDDISNVTDFLAIIVDVNTEKRVHGFNVFEKGIESLKIDHHPYDYEITQYSLSNIKAASTTQIITDIAKNTNLKINKEIASDLYLGLLTDTLKFKTNNTTSETLKIAAYLLEYDLDIVDLNLKSYNVDLQMFNFETFVRNKANIINKFAYIILSYDDYTNKDIPLSKAKSLVSIFSNLNCINTYAIFCETANGLYEASLRSFVIPIDHIAKKYNGGGHKCACGVKNINISQVEEIVSTMSKL